MFSQQLKSRIVYFLTVSGLLYGFVLTNKYKLSLHSTQTVIDNFIPLIPIFSLPYILYIPLLLGTLLLWILKLGKLETLFLNRFILAQLIAIGFFVFYPTQMIRIDIVGSGISNSLVKFIYSTDQPYNLFPSTHVLHTCIIMQYWIMVSKRKTVKFVLFVITFLICVSTVLIKQHYAIDIIGGLAIFGLVNLIIGIDES